MKMIYGCLAVEGPSWTNPDCLAIQLINTVNLIKKKIIL